MQECLYDNIFNVISGIITDEKLEAYVIGGYVRDLYLGRPSKDIDIVIVGNGIDIAKKTAELLGKGIQVAIFKNFGTAQIKYNDLEIEFVGARKESYRKDSRKPIVEGGSFIDDQNRRDFTINTLALGLNQNNFGQLLDPFNGLKDIKEKIIRTPLDPEITFSDDPLRMLRAIRFASQLNFIIEENTLHAIKHNISRMEIISAERITDEINKIILSSKPSIGFRLLEETGLLKNIIPELQALKGVESIEGVRHKDNFYHTIKVLDNLSQVTNNLWLRWAALLHDIGKPGVKKFYPNQGWTFHGHEFTGVKIIEKLFRRLKLPLNEKLKYVQKMVSLHHRPMVLSTEEVTDSAVRRLLFEANDDIDDLMTLCEADITSQNNELKKRYLANFKLVRKKMKELEEKDAIRNFQPPVSGEEIMEAFHIQPCKEVGIIKNAIKEAILEGIIHNNYEEAHQFMIDMGKKLGLK